MTGESVEVGGSHLPQGKPHERRYSGENIQRCHEDAVAQGDVLLAQENLQ